jgi:hypothetical protein
MVAPNRPTFRVEVDFVNDPTASSGPTVNMLSAAAASFEDGTAGGWVASGSTPPTQTNSTVANLYGARSLRAAWVTGSSFTIGGTQVVTPALTAGVTYTASVWLYAPSGSTLPAFGMANGSGTVSFASTSIGSTGVWQRLSQTFTPLTSGTLQLAVWPVTSSVAGSVCFVDGAQLELGATATPFTDNTETFTDITRYVRGRGDSSPLLDTTRGRDYELSRCSTGTFSLMLDNTDGRFDPTNPASPYVLGTLNPGGLTGLVTSGRRIRIRATYQGVTYGIFRGYVDEWPQAWQHAGFYGEANVTGTDGFAALAAIDLDALVIVEALKDSPQTLYRANDPTGSVSAGNSSTTNQPLSAIVAGANARATDTFAFGSTEGDGALVGDPTSSLAFGPTPTVGGIRTSAAVTGYCLRTAQSGAGALTGYSTSGGSFVPPTTGYAVELWFRTSTATAANFGRLWMQYGSDGIEQSALTTYASSTATGYGLEFTISDRSSGSSWCDSTVDIADGKWHHVVCGRLAGATDTPFLYVDGVSYGPNNVNANTWGSVPAGQNWGGNVTPTTKNGGAFFSGNIKNLATYSAPLSAARILAHYQAGSGFSGDNSATRIGRILDAAVWPTSLRSLPTGDSAVGSQSTESVKALEALQTVTDTEGGVLFCDPDGKVKQTSRSSRYNGAASATFGEAGTYKYLGDLVVQLDPKDVYNDVTVTREAGSTIHAVDSASQLRYFPRSLSAATIAVNDSQSVYLAEHLLARYKEPHVRVPTLSLDPLTQPALWPIVLGLDIGSRITVSRKPGNAPSISRDYFIERVRHQVTATSWRTTWQLSPAETSDYMVLDDATFGHLAGSAQIGGAINSVTTTASVLINAGAPVWTTADVPFYAQIDSEVVLVTAVGALTLGNQALTITRAQRGTVAAAHSATATVTALTYPLAY